MRPNRTLLLKIVQGGAASATMTRRSHNTHATARPAQASQLEHAAPPRADAHETLLRTHRIVQPFELG